MFRCGKWRWNSLNWRWSCKFLSTIFTFRATKINLPKRMKNLRNLNHQATFSLWDKIEQTRPHFIITPKYVFCALLWLLSVWHSALLFREQRIDSGYVNGKRHGRALHLDDKTWVNLEFDDRRRLEAAIKSVLAVRCAWTWRHQARARAPSPLQLALYGSLSFRPPPAGILQQRSLHYSLF